MTKIGFIGLGHMGLPMALQCSKKFNLLAYDQNPEACQSFIEMGGKIASSLQAMIKTADVVISMLPNGEILLAVYQDILDFIPANTLLIDCSTVGPLASLEWHKLNQTRGLKSVDAPVSGGVKAAAQGSLSFMLGGHPDEVQAAIVYLSSMGKNFIPTGGPGSGQTAKICNNLVLGNTMIAVSEAFILGQNLGLEPNKLLDVLSMSSGNSWVIENYLPIPNLGRSVPADNDYQAGFSAAMMLKDLKLANQAAKQVGKDLELSAKSENLYQELIDNDKGHKDFSYIYQALSND
jgi:3-hydroxyisobutyrate dehydrogenase